MAMAVRIRSPQDLGAALIFVLIGAVGLYGGVGYGVVEHGELGAGYFPVVIGLLLELVGVGLLVRALSVGGPAISGFPWRPALVLTASLVAFAFLIPEAGLVVACLVATMLAALGRPSPPWGESILISLLLTAFCALVFVYGLGQPLKLWPS